MILKYEWNRYKNAIKIIQTNWHKTFLTSSLPNKEKTSKLSSTFPSRYIASTQKKMPNLSLCFTAVLGQEVTSKDNIIQCRLSKVALHLQAIITLTLMDKKSAVKLYSNIIKCSFDIITRVCQALSCKPKTSEFVILMPWFWPIIQSSIQNALSILLKQEINTVNFQSENITKLH